MGSFIIFHNHRIIRKKACLLFNQRRKKRKGNLMRPRGFLRILFSHYTHLDFQRTDLLIREKRVKKLVNFYKENNYATDLNNLQISKHKMIQENAPLAKTKKIDK